MNASTHIGDLSRAARSAAQARDWRTAGACAKQILKRDKDSPEGHFLGGLAAKGARRADAAEKSFRRSLRADRRRYDAAIELADLYVGAQRNDEALALLTEYVPCLDNSPIYLEMAAALYTRLNFHELAWTLCQKACDLQPQISRFQAALAASSVFVGRTERARAIYRALLEQQPSHQRYHFELAQLAIATDFEHVNRMKAILDSGNLPPSKNIFLYYALGKELEDLEAWDEAFTFYKMAGDAARSVSPYDVGTDIGIIDQVIGTCNATWLAAGNKTHIPGNLQPAPMFILGLPRTGTTLIERILSSHSQVQSIGETWYLQLALRRESGIDTSDSMNSAIIEAVAARNMDGVRARYMDAINCRLGKEPVFIEKLPENYLYLGFIAKAFPDARLVHMRRHPMDACFAMYKQSYFRFAYTLDDVGRYYVAYDRLMTHWRSLLGDRLIEVGYEDLVRDQERQTRRLLERLGLHFEAACLHFQDNPEPSATASAVQVREKVHGRSINRWLRFERQLAALKDHLESAGIDIAPVVGRRADK